MNAAFRVYLELETWTVPTCRMKAKRDNWVLLFARAPQFLHEARDLSENSDLVFPLAHGRVLSDNTISKLLQELRIETVQPRFRSSFRRWAADCSDAPHELAMAAHVSSERPGLATDPGGEASS